MSGGSEKRNGWLNLELQSPHVIERRTNRWAKQWKCLDGFYVQNHVHPVSTRLLDLT